LQWKESRFFVPILAVSTIAIFGAGVGSVCLLKNSDKRKEEVQAIPAIASPSSQPIRVQSPEEQDFKNNKASSEVTRDEVAAQIKKDPRSLRALRIYHEAWVHAFGPIESTYKSSEYMHLGFAMDKFKNNGLVNFHECIIEQLQQAQVLYGPNHSDAFRKGIEEIQN